MELNKNDQVINIIPLNEDAKDIIVPNYKAQTLDEVISSITDKLIEKDYTTGELVIVVGINGSITNEIVEEVISDKLTEKEIKYNLIIPEITSSAKEIAKEYNITESKAAYIEKISSESNLNIEDIKDLSINEIITKAKENEEVNNEVNSTVNEPSNVSDIPTNGGYGSVLKCDNVVRALSNEEAGQKVASLMGATINTGSYCDKLPPESVMLELNGTCAYKVSFKYRTKSCVYYIDVETGNIIGDGSCSQELVDEGEAQCIIMQSMGLTKREMFYAKNLRDTGSEYVYDVEDVYGQPDENNQRYIYEYHVSKYTGLITSKNKIDILH